MKRLIAIILSLSVLCANTGWTASVHYCMGVRVGASLLHPVDGEHLCEKCGMKKAASKKGCCKDKVITLKAAGDAAFTQPAFHFYPVIIALLPAQQFVHHSLPVFTVAALPFAARPHGPPLAGTLRLHLQNCLLLI